MPLITIAAKKQPKHGNDVKAKIQTFLEKLGESDATRGSTSSRSTDPSIREHARDGSTSICGPCCSGSIHRRVTPTTSTPAPGTTMRGQRRPENSHSTSTGQRGARTARGDRGARAGRASGCRGHRARRGVEATLHRTRILRHRSHRTVRVPPGDRRRGVPTARRRRRARLCGGPRHALATGGPPVDGGEGSAARHPGRARSGQAGGGRSRRRRSHQGARGAQASGIPHAVHLRRRQRRASTHHRGRRLRSLAGVPAPGAAGVRGEGLLRCFPTERRRRDGQDGGAAAPRSSTRPREPECAGGPHHIHSRPGRQSASRSRTPRLGGSDRRTSRRLGCARPWCRSARIRGASSRRRRIRGIGARDDRFDPREDGLSRRTRLVIGDHAGRCRTADRLAVCAVLPGRVCAGRPP